MITGYYTIEERAKRYYGLTEVPQFAGYLLKDGKMLNFSHEGRQRDCDHRDIAQFFTNSENKWSGTPFLYKFMRRGNIRCSCDNCCYGFEFAKIPTREQWKILKQLHKEAEDLGLAFIIEKEMPGHRIKKFDFCDFTTYIKQHADYYLY